jgi:PAS domain S-box-containing protein
MSGAGERGAKSRLGGFLHRRGAQILSVWEQEAGALPEGRAIERPVLLDHIPVLLERIGQLSDELGRGEDAEWPRHLAEVHALDRLKVGFSLPDVVRELSLLRDCILRLWTEEQPGGDDLLEVRLLNLALDRALSASVDQYTAARERTLRALDRTSALALETDELDDFLRGLLGVLQESSAAVDTAASLLLEDGDTLRVRAAAGLEEDLRNAFSLRVGEGFAGKIAAERRPVHLRSASTDPLVKSPMVRRKGVKALYGVPLLHGDRLVGVAHVGSLTARAIPEDERQLLESIASRATSGIYQHLLRDTAERRAQALAQSEQRVRLLLENIEDYAIILLDADGRIASWNIGAERTFGYASDIVGAHLSRFYPPESLDAGQPDRELRTAFEEGRADDECWLVKNDGTRFWASGVTNSIRDASGKLVGFTKVVRDLTERKKSEDERGRLLDEARRATRSREQVLAIVSHDLRNPLNSIQLASHLLLASPPNPKAERQLQIIHRSAVRMEHLIDDLLDLASIQGGRLSMDVRAVRASDVARDAVEAQVGPAKERDIELSTELSVDDVEVRCDPHRILQVFGNLLSNALKFCRAGDLVRVKGRVSGDHVLFAVEDTGPGIPDEEKPHLFEPFWSAARHRREGTGLGLYITRSIVEAHGGRIWVESSAGRGSTFYFTLPLATAGNRAVTPEVEGSGDAGEGSPPSPVS